MHSEALVNLNRPLRVVSDEGKGRACVIIAEDENVAFAAALAQAIASRGRALHVAAPAVTAENWSALAPAFGGLLSERGIRQASFVAFGAAGALAQSAAVSDLRMVRTMVLVDGATRPHPTFFQRVAGAIERSLPLGLPLRSRIAGFDAKPYLQRMRCPVLVVVRMPASAHVRAEAHVLARGLPTAWLAELAPPHTPEKLASLALEFQDVPVKCPQRSEG